MSLGRPTVFTEEVREKILVAIRKGASYEIAANYAGVSRDIFRQWRKEGKEGNDPDFVAFLAAIKEAKGHTALVWLDRIDKAMNEGLWTAAAWKLERLYPKTYGRMDKQPKKETNTESVEKARNEVSKLKADKHGRTAQSEG
jgi:hypothetical protein